MKTSDSGRKFIESNEGLRLDSYQDSVGVWTIGYGHTEGVQSGVHISLEQADMLLEADLEHVENALNKLIPADCTQNQFDALADFAFNMGIGALQTLLSHEWQNVSSQLPRWRYAGGREIPGLLARRQREIALFNS